MRPCQICDATGKRVILSKYKDTPHCLFECTQCGHRYLDGLELSQPILDDYYVHKYVTDDKPFSGARLASLADFIQSDDILDIGGTDKELQSRLAMRGKRCDVAGVGDDFPYHDTVVLSHVLEHVYDINELFCHIACAKIVIEIPIHLGYVDPLEYDYEWQHINKFRPQDIERLIEQKGYAMTYSKQIDDYRGYKVWRIAGTNEGS